MSNDQQAFYVPYGTMFKYMFLNILPLSLILAAILFFVTPPDNRLTTLVLILVLTLVFAMVAALLTSFKPRVFINSGGIKAHDTGGKLQFAEWNSIIDARYRNRFGIKYIFVDTKETKRELVIPLFLANLDIFKREVLTFSGENNPFFKVLTLVTDEK